MKNWQRRAAALKQKKTATEVAAPTPPPHASTAGTPCWLATHTVSRNLSSCLTTNPLFCPTPAVVRPHEICYSAGHAPRHNQWVGAVQPSLVLIHITWSTDCRTAMQNGLRLRQQTTRNGQGGTSRPAGAQDVHAAGGKRAPWRKRGGLAQRRAHAAPLKQMNKQTHKRDLIQWVPGCVVL
jgi:hypothetical protein